MVTCITYIVYALYAFFDAHRLHPSGWTKVCDVLSIWLWVSSIHLHTYHMQRGYSENMTILMNKRGKLSHMNTIDSINVCVHVDTEY